MQPVEASGNISALIIRNFLAKLQREARLPVDVIDELERLANNGALSKQEEIETAVKKAVAPDDQAEES